MLCFSRELKDFALVEGNCAAILADGCFKNWLWRMLERLLCREDDSRDLRHASDAVGYVGFPGQSRLRQQHIHTVVDVIIVCARVFFERLGIFCQPNLRFELVFKNFKINLSGPRKSGIIYLARKLPQGAPAVSQPAFTRLKTDILQLRVKSMITKFRCLHRPQPKMLIQVSLKKGLQLLVFRRFGKCLRDRAEQRKAGQAAVD